MDQHTQIMQAFAQPAPMRASNGASIGGTVLNIAAVEYLQEQGAPLTNANFDAARRVLTANPEMAANLPSVQAAMQKMNAMQPVQRAVQSAPASAPAPVPMRQPMQPPVPMRRSGTDDGTNALPAPTNTLPAPQSTMQPSTGPAPQPAPQSGASDHSIAQQIIATILGGLGGGALGYGATRMMQRPLTAGAAMDASSRPAPSVDPRVSQLDPRALQPDPVIAGVLGDGALNGEILPPQQALGGPAQASTPPQRARIRGPQDVPQVGMPSESVINMPPERATSLQPPPANRLRDARGDTPLYTDKAAQTGTSLRTNPDGSLPASGKFTPTDNKRARTQTLSPQKQRQQDRTGRTMNATTPTPKPNVDFDLDPELYAPPPANFDPANPQTWPTDPRQINTVLKRNPKLGEDKAFQQHIHRVVQALRSAPRAIP